MSERKQLQRQLLIEYKSILEKSLAALRHSFDKCESIANKQEYTLEDEEAFEAMTSRFARTSDIFYQKFLRCFFELVEEYPRTMIDMLNSAAKKGIVQDVDSLADIRKLRNDIAHEYWIENLRKKFDECLQLAPILMNEIAISFDKVEEIVLNH